MAETTLGEAYGEAARGASPVTIVHLAGGVLSLALIVGAVGWGAKMILRDVSGVPVVHAMADGPMRVAPENPGGEIAAHAGLTVNTIAAEGEAGAPEDRLVLAPANVDLADEDLEVTPLAEAGEVAPTEQDVQVALEEVVPTAADADTPLNADEVLALADRIAAEAITQAGAETDVAEPEVANPQADAVLAALEAASEIAAPRPAVQVISASIPGVVRSIRPSARPGATAAIVQAAAPIPDPTVPVLTEELPAGTKLVQLGAYDTPALAEADWQRISARFADFMGGKSPVIQQATSGGRTFFRLRTQGFSDLNDARRFCSVLMAENAACIPVVVR